MEVRAPGMVEAKAREISSALTVENLDITKAIARINRCATIAEEKGINQATALILRKLVQVRHHLGSQRVQEKGLMESAGGPSKQRGAQRQWLC